jgi:hypothetical protein
MGNMENWKKMEELQNHVLDPVTLAERAATRRSEFSSQLLYLSLLFVLIPKQR